MVLEPNFEHINETYQAYRMTIQFNSIQLDNKNKNIYDYNINININTNNLKTEH